MARALDRGGPHRWRRIVAVTELGGGVGKGGLGEGLGLEGERGQPSADKERGRAQHG